MDLEKEIAELEELATLWENAGRGGGDYSDGFHDGRRHCAQDVRRIAKFLKLRVQGVSFEKFLFTQNLHRPQVVAAATLNRVSPLDYEIDDLTITPKTEAAFMVLADIFEGTIKV